MRRRTCVLRALNSSKYATYFPTTHRSHMEKKMLLGYTLTFPRREKIVQNGRNAPDDVLRVLQAVRFVHYVHFLASYTYRIMAIIIPSIAPAITSTGVCPKSSLSFFSVRE